MYLGKLVTWHANTDAVPRWLPKLEINIFPWRGEKLLRCFSWIMGAFYMMIQQSSPCSPLIFVGAFSLPTSVIFMLLNDSFLLVGTLNVTASVCPLGIKRKKEKRERPQIPKGCQRCWTDLHKRKSGWRINFKTAQYSADMKRARILKCKRNQRTLLKCINEP